MKISHYHLYEYFLRENIINVFDCTESDEKCTDYKDNALKILCRIMNLNTKQNVAKSAAESKKKNYWLFKSFHPYTVFRNNCACCVIMQILKCTSLFGISEIIDDKHRRQYYLSLYLRLFHELPVENFDDSITIHKGEMTLDIILEIKRFCNVMSNKLNDDQKAKQILMSYTNCGICKKKIVPYDFKETDEVEFAKKSMLINIHDCLEEEFKIYELHCDCFKLFHGKCCSEELLGLICNNCGVTHRAEYCYVCGDLDYIKTHREVSVIVNNDTKDQHEEGTVDECEQAVNLTNLLVNSIEITDQHADHFESVD